jgi:hypothetical protein
MQRGLQIGLTEGQAVSRAQFGPVKWIESSLARSLDKGLVERDLDHATSTYTKYRKNPDSAERCPSKAQRSSKYTDVRT